MNRLRNILRYISLFLFLFLIQKKFYFIYLMKFILAEPKTRPRLNLQRRTLPVEETAAPTKPAVTATKNAPSSSSIFGGAKPVDTAARERQIEERLAREKTDHPPSYRESKDAREPREPREQGDEPPQAWSRKNMVRKKYSLKVLYHKI